MRLGDVLVEAGLISEEQLAEALRAQVMWGARLGTNLVELGFINLDELSTALGRLHGLPAALGSHFDRADTELQRALPVELAQKYACIPLVRAGKRIVIASIEPLEERAVALVAGQLDINRMMIVQSIAAEMRIRFQLERVYDIQRDPRFMRARGTETSEVFSIDEVKGEPATRSARVPVSLPPPVVIDELPPVAAATVEEGVERRAYVPTLADMLANPAAQPAKHDRPLDPAHALAIGSSMNLPKIDVSVIPPSLPEALSDIELAPDRETLAKRVIGAVVRFVPESRSALLLVVRGDAAVSWTSYCRDGTQLPALAVPLSHPGLVAAVMRRKTTSRGASGDLPPIDYLLLTSLGVQFGDLVVAPFMIADHVIGSIVLATDGRRGALASLEQIRAATGEAFKRLMRRASAHVS